MITHGGRSTKVASATLELFHLYAEEAGWTLDATLDGGDRLALEGRVRTPALPGPSELVVWYVDAPRVVTLDGDHGSLGSPDPRARMTCTALGAGRVHVEGALELAWTALTGGASRPYTITIALDAALIT
ncbi:MAG: hypothetical protein AB7T06_18515 [Kofleriaceae bacterium]